jgi:hypothetical protein
MSNSDAKHQSRVSGQGRFGGATMKIWSVHAGQATDQGHRVLYVLIISLALAAGGMIIVALTGQSL